MRFSESVPAVSKKTQIEKKTRMVAVNTTQYLPSGKAWFGGQGCSSRVDYILVSDDRTGDNDKAILSHEMHSRLKTMVGLEAKDHVPLFWDFQHAPWEKAAEGPRHTREHH